MILNVTMWVRRVLIEAAEIVQAQSLGSFRASAHLFSRGIFSFGLNSFKAFLVLTF
jgi:hypothetical protein